jgi:ABC-2 type transport system ATP-binding protein
VLAVRAADPARTADAAAALADLSAGDEPLVDRSSGEIRLPVADPSTAAEAVRRLDARGLTVASLELQQPSLDDVFLTLTGRRSEPDAIDPEAEREAA